MLETLTSFLDYWTKARERTTRILDRIPNDDLEWREAPDRFSFGDLFRHLAAAERYMWAETVSGRPSSYPGHDLSLDRKSTRLNSSHPRLSRMPSSA